MRAWHRRRLLPSLTRAWHWHRHWRVLRAPRSVRSGLPTWLEPYPGPFVSAPRGSVPASGDSPETVSLVFVAALQRLPPRQRAALVLTDVYGFGVAEVAEILDCGVGRAERLVTRARAAIAPMARQEPVVEDAVIARFTGAFERGDVAGIAALLTSDAWLRMRPLPVEYQGRSAARHFFESVAFPGGTSRYRLVATRANGQPAFGCYLRDPEDGCGHACGLVVLTIAGDQIAAIDRFVDNSLMPRFGLPRTLPDELPGFPYPPGYPGRDDVMITGHRCPIWSPMARDHETAGRAGCRPARTYRSKGEHPDRIPSRRPRPGARDEGKQPQGTTPVIPHPDCGL